MIGVLALQGSVAEHMRMLSGLGDIEACEVRCEGELEKVSGLILPGGESTTLGKLLKDFRLAQPIIDRIVAGMPVWGTCAGMILLAEEIAGESCRHLGVMDISVRRNAYGRQLDSFSTKAVVPGISKEAVPMVFIRAPWVERAEENVDVLAEINGRIVAVRQDNMLATSFHPELTGDLSFHRYFANMAKNRNFLNSESNQ